MKRKILLGLLFFSGILLASCSSSTRVVSAWQTPNATSPMSKVLVMAMMNDRQAKDNIESQLVRDLTAQGITAISGTYEFGPRGFGDLTQKQIHQKLTQEGFSSVMIICLTDKDKEVNYVPGSSYVGPYGPGYYGRYRYMYDRVYDPGYFTSTTTYVLDADIYSLPDDQLIYSAQTRSYDPSSSRELAKSFSEEIINDLKSRRLLQNYRPL